MIDGAAFALLLVVGLVAAGAGFLAGFVPGVLFGATIERERARRRGGVQHK